MTRSRAIAFGTIALGVLVVGTSLALAVEPPPPSSPVAFVPSVRATNTAVTPIEALSSAVAAIGPTAVASATVGGPPAGPPQQNRAGMPWLYESVRVPSLENGEQILPLWEADLIEGATVERSGSSADIYDDFGGATFEAVLPDGTTVTNVASGLGDIARGQQFADSAKSEAQIESEAHASLQRFGLSAVSVRVLHALGDAVSVIATTTDPVHAAENLGPIINTLFGDPPGYEGYYLEIRDSAGNAIVRTSAAFLTGAGRLWVAPAYQDDLVGIRHG
jgi:hypothetical protein